MSKYIYSTLTSSQVYRGQNGVKVRVNGGANSPDKTLHTPRGVATKVTDEQFDVLKTSKLFLKHQKAGFINTSLLETNPEKVARNMQEADKSAPDTESKLAAEAKEVPAKAAKK